MSRDGLVPLIAFLPALFGCEVDPSVTLEASVSSAELRVASSVLASELEGGFELSLSLGEFAEAPAEVTAASFTIQRDGAELVTGSAFAPQGVSFPVSIAPGETRRVPFTISGEVESDVASALCTGPIAIVGSVDDSESGGPTRAASAGFTADCTP